MKLNISGTKTISTQLAFLGDRVNFNGKKSL